MNKYVITTVKGKKILATFSDTECRELKVLDEQNLTGNIYVARVENVVKNIGAAFLILENGIKCYYSLQDNSDTIFLNTKNTTQVCQGDYLLVQVTREPIKTKPATASCKLTLPGEYVALASDGSGVHVSAKVKKEAHCIELKETLTKIFFPSQETDVPQTAKEPANMPFSLILRTNAATAKTTDVLAEAKRLVKQYQIIRQQARFHHGITCVYQTKAPYMQAIQNIRLCDDAEIVTDDKSIYDALSALNNEQLQSKLRFYADTLLPLYKLYSLETIVEKSLATKVWLKSGGYLVIEQTEALTVVDVNSGKQVTKKGGSDAMDCSNFKTNKEAMIELKRQMGLRNLSGIIIIDFINLKNAELNDQFIAIIKEECKKDTAGARFIDMTGLGLVELTRKKTGKSLREYFCETDMQ